MMHPMRSELHAQQQLGAVMACRFRRQVMAAMPAGRLAGALAGGAAGLAAGLESRDAELLQRLEALRWAPEI